MGCCISKCRPDPKHSLQLQHQFNRHQIQDKLVISRTPPPPPITTLYPSSKHKITPSPSSPTSSSTSSLSSFTRTTTTSNTISSSASSISSASSSTLTSSKFDKSFSNEFLWSCYKENPHIARINSLKDASLSLTPRHHRNTINPSYINPSPPTPTKHYSSPQNGSFNSMPQKRMRSNSPTNLTRQKSLRKEPPMEPIIVTPSATNMINMRTSRTTLGSSSPSPSRRFIGDKCGNALGTTSINMRKDQGLKSTSTLNNNSQRFLHAGLRHRETCNLRVGSKIDETVVKDVMSSNHEVDATMMEDIDNPLISLDCFIFL